MLVLNWWPVLSVTYFPSLDGPAHLYNADLIQSILFEKDSFVADYFSFHREPVPNWTGHLLLMFLGFFFSALWTQKIFLIVLISALPLAFRALMKTAQPAHHWFSWLVFPFVYSFVFYLGFYNFLLGLVFLMITLAFNLRGSHNRIPNNRLFHYFILFALCYFSHVFVFAMLLCCLAIQEFFQLFSAKGKDSSIRQRLLNILSNAIKLALPALPFLILLLYYFWKRPPIGEPYYMEKTVLMDWIKNVRPIIALHFQIEEAYTKKIFYLISALLVISLYELLKIGSDSSQEQKSFMDRFQNKLKRADAWLWMTALFLFLYFYLPDSDGNAGFVSVRLGLLFFLFLILWIGAQPLPLLLGVFSALLSVYCNFSLNEYYLKENEQKSAKIEDLMAVKKLLQPNTVLLPLNFEEDWLLGHSPNLLGVDNAVVVLENYEAATNYFPLRWKDESLPDFRLGESSIAAFNCISCRNNVQGKHKAIDYIYKMGNRRDTTNACENDFFAKVESGYEKIYSGFNGILWKRKGM
jgi:hypothetical protein